MTSDGSNPRTFGNVLGMLQLAAILLQFAGLIWLGGRWSAEMNATAERVRELQGPAEPGQAAVPVVISADKNVKYESVVQVMDKLQRAGIQRVGLSVQQNP